MLSGCANSCSCVPASAHQAVTSRASGPGPKPFVRPLGGASGVIRSTIQSLLPVDQAPGGIVTAAKPSADSTVVDVAGVVLFSTGGASEPDDDQTVKWTRNGAFLPEESCSSPASVCGPGESAPVPNVIVLPLMTGVTAAAPSRVAPLTVAASLVTSEIELADETVAPSAGVDDTTRGAVLSICTPVTTSSDVLPRLSVTVARKS